MLATLLRTMTGWTASRREALAALGATTAGMLGISTVTAQANTEVTVTVGPSETTVLVGDTVTLDVVVQGASEGIIAYEFDLLLGDTSVGTVVSFEEPRGLQKSEIIGDGEGVHFETALIDESYDGAERITLGTVTLSGGSVGESSLTVENATIQEEVSSPYETTADPGTLTVEPDDRALSAALDLEPTEPLADEAVSFDASGSTGEIVAYNWAFGDGTEETTDSPLVTHTYDEPGEYEATVEVEGGNGNTDQTSETVTVTGSATGVTAAFDWQPANPVAGDVVNFDASGSAGSVVEYRWDFTGDGTVDESSDGPGMVAVYDEPGEYEVTLEVEGDSGDTDQTTATLSVAASAVQLDPAFDWQPANPVAGETLTFDATASSGNVVEYRWDFTGDGTVDETVDVATTSFTYGETGTRTVTLEVVDGTGEVASTSRELVVESGSDGPAPPTASLDVTVSDPVAGEAVTFDAGGSEGDIVEYEWSFGDGSGEVIGDSTVSHTYDEAGTFTVGVTVTDSADQTDSTSRELAVGTPDDGSDNGTDNGSDDSTDDGSDDDTDNGSDNGTDNGSDNGTDNGSDDSTDDGSDDSTDDGSDDSTDNGSDTGAENASDDGSGDGLGPGFGPVSALSGLGGAVYLLRRRLLDGDKEE